MERAPARRRLLRDELWGRYERLGRRGRPELERRSPRGGRALGGRSCGGRLALRAGAELAAGAAPGSGEQTAKRWSAVAPAGLAGDPAAVAAVSEVERRRPAAIQASRSST